MNVGDDIDDDVRLAEVMDVSSSSGFFTTVNINGVRLAEIMDVASSSGFFTTVNINGARLAEVVDVVSSSEFFTTVNVNGGRLAEVLDVAASSGFFTAVNISYIEVLLQVQLLKYGDDSLVHWLCYRYGVGRQELNLHMFTEIGDKMAEDLEAFLTSSSVCYAMYFSNVIFQLN